MATTNQDLSEKVSLLLFALQSHHANVINTNTLLSTMKESKVKHFEADSRRMEIQGVHTSLCWRADEIALQVEAALPGTIIPMLPQRPDSAQIQAFIVAMKAAQSALLVENPVPSAKIA